MLSFDVSSMPPFSAYYRIGVADEGTTIVIDIPTHIWATALRTFKIHTYRTEIKKWLHLPQGFMDPNPLPWGFCPAFTDEPSLTKDWHRVRYELPYFDTELEDSWKRGLENVASLWFLLIALQDIRIRERHTSQTAPYQLVEVNLSASIDRGHHYAINAGLSDACCNWIVRHEQSAQVDTISECMQRAYCRLQGLNRLQKHDKHECGAMIREHCALSFHVPGDRTFLGTATNRREEHGIELYDHNVDNATQLLTLLVGLGAFSDFVAQDL